MSSIRNCNWPYQNIDKGGLEPRIIIVTKYVLVILTSTRKKEENWVFTHMIVVRAVLERCKARHSVLRCCYVVSSDKVQFKGTGITALRITRNIVL
jgi:hypothetical protein